MPFISDPVSRNQVLLAATGVDKVWLDDAGVIQQIDSGYKWSGQTISYSWPASAWGSGGEFDGFSSVTPAQQSVIAEWMKMWDDLISPATKNMGMATTDNNNLRFGNTTTGPSYAWADYPFASYAGIWFNSKYTENYDRYNDLLTSPSYGEWGFLAIGHEIGHALGLDHPGAYNGDGPTYDTDAEYAQDSVMYTIMSYFEASNTGAASLNEASGYDIQPQTPMVDDILVIQSIYGADTTTRTGNTVYGFNSNAGRNVYNFNLNVDPCVCIYDAGGVDTLDLSGWSTNSVISLLPGSFSDGDKRTKNISIARNTIIENAKGGSGNDLITGNTVTNALYGNGGSDTLNGGAGNDSLNGGTGADKMSGGLGNDVYTVTDTGDVVTEAANGGTDSANSYLSSYTLGANVENARVMSTGAANLTGNSLNNLVYAGVGNNVLKGEGGTDTLSYAYGLSSTSTVGVTVSLASTGTQSTGGSGSDTLSGFERLIGSSKNDKLTGSSASNILNGGAGNDTLIGGAGKDSLTGGTGNDSFDFNALSETGTASTTWDVITDFVRGQDKIDLSTLDANTATTTNDAFSGTLIAATASFTRSGQLKLASGVVYGNTDADANAEFAIQVTGMTALAATDFIL